VSARRLTLYVMSKMKRNKLKLFVVALVLLLPLELLAQDSTGWRKPENKELGNDYSWRKEDPNLYLTAKADFDDDGKEDMAFLLINVKQNKMGLFVELTSRPGKKMKLDESDDKSWIEVMGIAVAKPGKYKTACGKGYFDCEKGEPKELSLKLTAIDYFKEGSANSFFIWDTKKKKFNRIWMSD
jgi:hypothetical protein